MAKKLKETYIHTYIHTDRLPLVVLSAAVAAKNRLKYPVPGYDSVDPPEKSANSGVETGIEKKVKK